MCEWDGIREEYIATDVSYRALAEKYGISKSRLQQLGAKEDWAHKRKLYRGALMHPSEDPRQQLNHAAQLLLRKIETAIQQLDVRQSVQVRKEKEVLYENPERRDKPTKEIITESEQCRTVECPVDRQGVQILAKALRDVKELLREEEDSADGLQQVIVRLEGDTENYAM